MCKWCVEHTARKVWYLEPENHKLGTLNRFHRFWDWNIDMGILYGTIDNISEKKKPWKFPKKQFFDMYAKRIHGGQLVASLDEALDVLELSQDVYQTYCTCRHSTHEEHPKLYKCLLLNNDAEQARRWDGKAKLKGKPKIGKFIDPEDAREIIIDSRKYENCFQTILWKWPPRVACLCNCDQYCASWWAPEIAWGQLPSFKRSTIDNPDACDECGICKKSCYKNAISLTDSGPKIDVESCIGCGLCVENCHVNVFTLESREVIYDRQQGSFVNLIDEMNT
ncbi:MAG: ATP-binding protein [Candidatus Hodarchaeales archaeon]|jgi:ferredoxin